MSSYDNLVVQRVLKFKMSPLLVCFSPHTFSSAGADGKQVESWFCEENSTKRRARELGKPIQWFVMELRPGKEESKNCERGMGSGGRRSWLEKLNACWRWRTGGSKLEREGGGQKFGG